MIVYRLTKGKYKNQISGFGAELNGGRWNSKRKSFVYTSESRALCTAEVAVHIPLGILPINYFLQSIKILKSSIQQIKESKLKRKWKNFPHDNSTKIIGDQFIRECKSLTLKVPSAVIQDEFNFLINPNHQNFIKVELIKVEPFKFDKRLFDK